MKSAGPCIRCKCEVWITDALYEAAQHGRGKVEFYCGYGHSMVFAIGESDLNKMRRERDRLAQQLAERDDRITKLREENEHTERRRRAAAGQVTKIKNRVGHGVCPCCNRTFGNLASHMMNQHPNFIAEAAE